MIKLYYTEGDCKNDDIIMVQCEREAELLLDKIRESSDKTATSLLFAALSEWFDKGFYYAKNVNPAKE